MPHPESHHVTVELKKDYQFVVRFDDVQGGPTLVCDEPEPLGQGNGPNPADLLGAAVGNCLAASLAFCLRKARMDPRSLSARVTTHVARNERGRFRISGIDVELSPDFVSSAAAGGIAAAPAAFATGFSGVAAACSPGGFAPGSSDGFVTSCPPVRSPRT